MSRRRLAFAAVAAVLVLLFGGRWVALRYTEYLWFADLGQGRRYLHLLLRALVWQSAAFAAAFVWYGAHLFAVARSIRSVLVPRRLGNIVIAEAVPPRLLRTIAIGSAAVLAVGTAASFGDLDHFVALYRGARAFGLVEPVLGRDAAFYLARLPLIETLHLYAAMATVLAFLLVITLYALTGSITIVDRRPRITPQARGHLVVLLTALALVLAWAFLLDAWRLVGGGGSDAGVLSAADRAIRLPADNALALLALAVAVGTGLGLRWVRGTVPILAFWTTLTLATVIGRYVVPAVAASWGPGDVQLAASLRQHRDGYTRAAFGLTAVTPQPLPVSAVPAPESSAVLAARLAGTVLWTGEPALLESALRRATGDSARLRTWTSAVVAAGTTPLVLAVSQPDPLVFGRRGASFGWTQTHRAALAWGGEPVLLDGSLRTGPARVEIPRPDSAWPAQVRFLAGPASLAVVGADEARPGRTPPGVLLSGPVRRLLLAWALQSPPLLDDHTSPSDRVLYWRDVPARLARLYPFAIFGPARPLLDHGRLLWAVDGYLASTRFPLAARVSWGGEDVNYLAAAYVATVDAATGETLVYLRRGQGDFARAVARAEHVDPLPPDRLPADVALGLDYPVGLLGAQSAALALLGAGPGTASWQVASSDTAALHSDAALLRPTQAVLRLPGDAAPGLWRLVPLADSDGAALTGILAAGTGRGGALRLRLLRTASAGLPTPQAAAARLAASPAVVAAATVAGQGATVRRGPLHVVPAAGTVAYVQVLFAGQAGGPLEPYLVTVLAGGRVGLGTDATEAVRSLGEGGADGGAATARALADARSAFLALEAARRSGDWVAFGHAWEALRRALQPATGAERQP